MGGLGNQLFQYNFALFLYENFPNAKIRLNNRYFKNDSIHGGWQLEKVAFPIDRCVRKKWRVVNDESFFVDAISDADNIVFDGYWQDTKFFAGRSFSFEDLFLLPADQKNLEWKKLIQSAECPVSVHVRCGDYNNHFLLGNVATRSYFNNAICEALKENPNATFFVFSDDIEWAKKNLNFASSNVFYVYGNEAADKNKYDLYLMSLCKVNIISNSSFSWWAHWFNAFKDKRAYAPAYWINQTALGFPSTVSNLQKLDTVKKVANVPCVKECSENPLFSIIISAYNQSDCIKRALSSVLNQAFKNFEAIVVDDCSTDETPNVLAWYEQNDARVRVIRHEKNKSLYEARKTGVFFAKGKYILFLDGDDWLFDGALLRISKEVVGIKAFDVCEFPYIIRPSGRTISPDCNAVSMGRIDYFLQENIAVTVWNKLYDADLLKRAFNSMPELYINLGEDTAESTCIAFFTKKYAQSDVLVTNYMSGLGVSTRKQTLLDHQKNCDSIKNAILTIRTFYQSHSDEKTAISMSSVAERRFFSWELTQIAELEKTDKDAAMQAYLLLPKTFSAGLVKPVFEKLYQDACLYRAGYRSYKCLARRCFLFIKKSAKKIVKIILPAPIFMFLKNNIYSKIKK